MKLYSDFVLKYPRSEEQLQSILLDVLTPNATPFNERPRHHQTWLHLQKMFPVTAAGNAALEAEIAGSDGDFSEAASYELEIKTELFMRGGVGGVIDNPLGRDAARHYALLYGLLCDAVTKDLIDDMYRDADYSRIPKPPLKMACELHDEVCYLCGFKFSTGLYGHPWVLYCCDYKETLRDGTVLCCRTVWHGRCAGLSWSPGDNTPFVGPCGHPCLSTMDAQRMQLDAIQETQMEEREQQIMGWQAVMDPDELLSSPEAAMERSILGDVMHELDGFLHQVSQLNSESQRCELVQAKCALSHVIAQTHLLPQGTASKIMGQLYPHMHLLHIMGEIREPLLVPEPVPLIMESTPMGASKAQVAIVAEGEAPPMMNLVPVDAEMNTKKPLRRSSVASSKGDFVALCGDPNMIDAVDQSVGTWSLASNLTFAVHRIFCTNQAKLTSDKWSLSTVSTVLIPLTNSSGERLTNAKERTIVALQLLLHLQKKKFLTVTPDMIAGNHTVRIAVAASTDDPTVPVIATSGFVTQLPHLWSDASIKACISNFRKPKWKSQKRKKHSDVDE